MRIALTERFQRDVRGLRDDQRSALFDLILALPKVIADPARPAGAGFRKIHASGVWEARLGLALRLVLTVEPDTATLVRIGDHDEIRRFLRSL